MTSYYVVMVNHHDPSIGGAQAIVDPTDKWDDVIATVRDVEANQKLSIAFVHMIRAGRVLDRTHEALELAAAA